MGENVGFDAKRVTDLAKKAGINLSPAADTIAVGEDLFNTFSKAQKNQIAITMKKLGKTSKNIADLKNNLEWYFGDIYSNARSFGELNNQLLAEYLPGDGTTANLPRQNVQQYDDAVLGKLVDKAYAETGKLPDQKTRSKIVKQWQAEIAQGTITTTEKVGGKVKTVTTPGFTAEEATTKLSEKLKVTEADSVKLTKALGFANDMDKIMAGGM